MSLTDDSLLMVDGGVYHLRVYEDTSWLPLAIVGQLSDTDGPSVTNAIEAIAAAVDAYLELDLGEGDYVLVEHWPRTKHGHLFDRVDFDTYGNGYANPRWRTVSDTDVMVLAGGVLPAIWSAADYTSTAVREAEARRA